MSSWDSDFKEQWGTSENQILKNYFFPLISTYGQRCDRDYAENHSSGV